MACRPLNIAMACDYSWPKLGGVEEHIYMLSQELLRRGHKVVIITHAYASTEPNSSRTGIRYLPNGLKVYHLPLEPIPPQSNHATLPQMFASLPLVRQVLIREEVEILHAHQAMSSQGLESILHARAMGIRALFTDHSLQGFGGWGEMWGNKMLKSVLSDVEAVIAVSHTCRENTVLRAALNPDLVHVIPNAVVASKFSPDPLRAKRMTKDTVTVVCISRLAYRKGIDLLIGAVPRICEIYPDVKFIIGGDGPKVIELEQMRERHQQLLRGRVELLGPVRHEQVRDVLIRGEIFLNTSLTEAFGMGILEAACSGLYVVSTRVGGIPEVLPDHLISFAQPDVEDVVQVIGAAIDHIRSGRHDPVKAHEAIRTKYSWADVAERTERVYEAMLTVELPPLVERLRRIYGTGVVHGKVMCIVALVNCVFLALLEVFDPSDRIDKCPAFSLARYNKWSDAVMSRIP
ncbi:glycosyltransferase family 4 protein [Mixia osmundae IAM 14324]|uniref:PIGA GPI anchor biosynthesis domain-containing protein n=1 Tax=Mixia osmundae (strain CBS 9802 / IAM 14324 / JCM 22182 / KY 12970) TaxID=764103 RepID=G7EA85_MIXOS|nr:glycosyltransferase family 4 protein [Mixia osmundae IAM 14324]KEI39437.1 glycosyltransferase family 4 protein [Mixia osmundae IAM 14324]GAA99745.1 hypothetical protein E5Q_06448 [Mixia osmundae IAM 14324]